MGARTARSTIGTAIAIVRVPGGRPGPEPLAGNGALVELAMIIVEEDETLVAVVCRGGCTADADSKGIVSVTMFITVVVLVAAGRLVTRGVAEGCT